MHKNVCTIIIYRFRFISNFLAESFNSILEITKEYEK